MDNYDNRDCLAIFKLLSVIPGGIGITQVQVLAWGTCLYLDCIYDWEVPRHFELIFEQCKNIIWESWSEPDEKNDIADVIDICLSKDPHLGPAVIETLSFEIIVDYEVVRCGWL